jgi:lysophospholipase L1-like esterase
MPPVLELLHNRLPGGQAPPIEANVLRQIAYERLPEIAQLCARYGAEFVLVVPPTYQAGEATIALEGNRVGVPVLVPVPSAEMKPDKYSDGFHLNADGARIFTTQLAGKLQDYLGQRSSPGNVVPADPGSVTEDHRPIEGGN